MGSIQGFRGFAKRSPGKEPTVPEGTSRVDKDDVDVPVKRPVLEGVIQDQNICAEMPDGGPSREEPPGAGKDRNSRDGAGDQDRFVSPLVPSHEDAVSIGDNIDRCLRAGAVAPAQDRRSAAFFSEKFCKEDHHRRLSGAAHGDVSHAENRAGEPPLSEEAPVVQAVSHGDGAPVGEGEESQKGG